MNHDDILAWSTVALAASTAGLLVATGFLSRHTNRLANLTQELVRFESRRESAARMEKRKDDLFQALDMARAVLVIDVSKFTAGVQYGIKDPVYPNYELQFIRGLARFGELLDALDTDCMGHLRWLITRVDSVSDGKSKLGGDQPEFTDRMEKLQKFRLPEVIRKWEAELRGENEIE